MSIDDATFKHVLPDACLEQETEHNLAYVRLAAKSQNPMSKFATASRKLRNQAERIIPPTHNREPYDTLLYCPTSHVPTHHPPIWCHRVDRRERGPRDG